MLVFPVREEVRKRWRGRRGEGGEKMQRRKKRGVKEGEWWKGRGGGKEGQREGIICSMVVQSTREMSVSRLALIAITQWYESELSAPSPRRCWHLGGYWEQTGWGWKSQSRSTCQVVQRSHISQ